jgi:hypothetical protein
MKVYSGKDSIESYSVENHWWTVRSGSVLELVDEFNLAIRTGFVFRCEKNGHITPLYSTLRRHYKKDCWQVLADYLRIEVTIGDRLAERILCYDMNTGKFQCRAREISEEVRQQRVLQRKRNVSLPT